jgi:hypothetical protein
MIGFLCKYHVLLVFLAGPPIKESRRKKGEEGREEDGEEGRKD